MVWSVQIPNPLTVGGNGDVGEIDVLNADGTPGIVLGSGPLMTFFSGSDPIIQAGIVSAIDPLNPLIIVEAPAPFASAQLKMYVLTTSTPNQPVIDFHDTATNNTARLIADISSVNTRTFFTLSADTGSGGQTHLILKTDTASGSRIFVDQPIIAESQSSPGTDETWHTLPLANGWVANTNTPQYRMMPDGGVRLRGWMDTGTNADGTTVANLPVGYRPNQEQRFITGDLTTGHAFRYVEVKTSGAITVFNCAGSSQLILDGIWFSVQI